MCNRHEQHFFSCDFVDELKGKASKEFSAKCPLEMRTQVRIGSDQAHRMIELIDELGTKPHGLALVECCGLEKLLTGRSEDPNDHACLIRRFASLSTSSRGTASISPLRYASSLRRTSMAHACSISVSSSRLAISRSARRARSPRGSARSASSSSSAVDRIRILLHVLLRHVTTGSIAVYSLQCQGTRLHA